MSLKNHYLIAMPTMQDLRFKHSVIYICEHNEEGAMGLVINKPIEKFSHFLKNIPIQKRSRKKNDNIPVLSGGPLSDDCGFILHTKNEFFSSSISISSSIMINMSKYVLEKIENKKNNYLLVALGYSGWAQGQLEQEILENLWITMEADTDILFHIPITRRWYESAKILGINIHKITHNIGNA